MPRTTQSIESPDPTELHLKGHVETDGVIAGGGGSGDVVGPASAVDNALVAFDGTTGKLVKDTGIDAGDVVTASGNLAGGQLLFSDGTKGLIDEHTGATGFCFATAPVSGSAEAFGFNVGINADEYLFFKSNAAGSGAEVFVAGAAANIDLLLNPKGTGAVKADGLTLNVATTKGDLIVYDGGASDHVRLPVAGTTGSLLASDTTDSTGMEWTTTLKAALTFQTNTKLHWRDPQIFIHSPSDGALVVESDGSALFRGLTSTTIGVAGDTIFGDSTLRVVRPAFDGMEDLGEDAYRFNDVFLSGDIDTEGDILFTGAGKGLTFGEISVKDNATVTTLNSAAKVQFLFFDTDGASNNATPDHTNDHITIVNAGLYLVTVSATIQNSAGAAHKVDMSVWKNNGASEFLNLHAHRNLSAGTDVASMSSSGIVDLATSDTMEIWLDTSRGVNSNVIVEDITLSILQLAGT